MAIEKPASWVGASGTQYTFYVFDLEPDVPKRTGSYIYAKRNDEGAWVPIYMGRGDLSACCTDPAALRCIASKASTHLHLRLNSHEADCAAELADLLAQYANAFAPEGCQPPPHEMFAAETSAEPARTEAPETAAAEAASKKAAPKNAAPKKATLGKAATAKRAPAKKAAAKRTPAKAAPAKTAPTKPPGGKPRAPRRRS